MLLTGFTFDEIQTLELRESRPDRIPFSFDKHSTLVVIDMMRGMFFQPDLGLGRRQQGMTEFIMTANWNVLN